MGRLPNFHTNRLRRFNQLLPPHWSRSNPVDLLGDAGAERYAKAVEIMAKDPNNDGILVVLTPQAMTDATATAEQLQPFAKLDGKPILASWMGGDNVRAGEEILNRCRDPNVRLSRHRRARLQLHVALQRQLAHPLRDSGPWRLLRCRSGKARARRSDHPKGTQEKADYPHRDRVKGNPRFLWHSRRRDSPCIERGGSRRSGEEHWRVRGAQGLFRDDYAQDGCGRREVEPARRGSGPAGLSRNRAVS